MSKEALGCCRLIQGRKSFVSSLELASCQALFFSRSLLILFFFCFFFGREGGGILSCAIKKILLLSPIGFCGLQGTLWQLEKRGRFWISFAVFSCAPNLQCRSFWGSSLISSLRIAESLRRRRCSSEISFISVTVICSRLARNCLSKLWRPPVIAARWQSQLLHPKLIRR